MGEGRQTIFVFIPDPFRSSEQDNLQIICKLSIVQAVKKSIGFNSFNTGPATENKWCGIYNPYDEILSSNFGYFISRSRCLGHNLPLHESTGKCDDRTKSRIYKDHKE